MEFNVRFTVNLVQGVYIDAEDVKAEIKSRLKWQLEELQVLEVSDRRTP